MTANKFKSVLLRHSKACFAYIALCAAGVNDKTAFFEQMRMLFDEFNRVIWIK